MVNEAYIIVGVDSTARQYSWGYIFGNDYHIEILDWKILSTVDSLREEKKTIQIFKSEEDAQKAARVKTYQTDENKIDYPKHEKNIPPVRCKLTYMPVRVEIDFSMVNEKEDGKYTINSSDLPAVDFSGNLCDLNNENGKPDVWVKYVRFGK